MHRRSLAWSLLALAALLLGASPDGCNGLNNVGVSDSSLAATSPDAKQSSWLNPVVVTRDNPHYQGSLYLTSPNVSSTGGGGYSSSGQWTNLSGQVIVAEHYSQTQVVDWQRSPLLPPGSYQSPGGAPWEGRSGALVHGNVYRAELSVAAGGIHEENIVSERPLWLKLSHEVAVVPVVVVSWRRPGNDPTFIDHTAIGKALFDFIPYHEPLYMPSELTLQGVARPNHGESIQSPTQYETPPDNLFHECGVQFQVVKTYVFDRPEGHVSPCNGSTSDFGGIDSLKAKIKAVDPLHGPMIVDTLQPLYVAYGDTGCDDGFQGGYTGNQPDAGLVEVNFQRKRVTTAHELGHALGLPHRTQNGQPVAGNLMKEGPDDNETKLEDDQCEDVLRAATSYSDRYDAFNKWTSRVDPGEILWSSVEEFTDLYFSEVDGDILFDFPMMCCVDDETGEPYQAFACVGSTPAPASVCEVCCIVDGDVETTPMSQCPDQDVVADAQCDAICCSEFGDTTYVTRYACDAAGGYEIACDPGELN